ncbi:MAG: hypothetical protein QM613_06310 [Micrococcaceae bacterium]
MSSEKELSRRHVTKTAAWSVPAIAAAVTTPAMAASTVECTTENTVSDASILTYSVQIIADSTTSYLAITNKSSTQCFSSSSLYAFTEVWSTPLSNNGNFTINGVAGSAAVVSGLVRIRRALGTISIGANEQLLVPMVKTSTTYLFGPGTTQQSKDLTLTTSATSITSTVTTDGTITITQHAA